MFIYFNCLDELVPTENSLVKPVQSPNTGRYVSHCLKTTNMTRFSSVVDI